MKIISGGQTGVDRAALDVALKYGVECGGWCPEGRLDEFGRIPDRYPVEELSGGDFVRRTLQNVIDSDATVIFCPGQIEGGTEYTVRCCREQKRPHVVIHAGKNSIEEAVDLIVNFVRPQKIEILNIAGPRQSEWSDGYDYAFAVLEKLVVDNLRTSLSRPANS